VRTPQSHYGVPLAPHSPHQQAFNGHCRVRPLSISSASRTDKLTEAEAISLADTEARIQGYHVDEYQRPQVDHSAVKGKWALFYGLKQDADAQGNLLSAFTVTVEDKTKKVEIRK